MPNLDNSEIMRTASEGKGDELRQLMREKALSSLYYFSKVVLGYKELSPSVHLEFCDHIQNSISERKRGYLIPRGHFKSTIVSKSYPLWRLIGGGNTDPNFDPRNHRILIVGESDKVAEKNLKDIKFNLEHNQILQWLFPEIIPPDVNHTKWTESEILLPRSKSFDEVTITAIGVGGKTTGFHYSIIIYDDMIGEKAAKSEPEMQAAITWYAFAPGLLDDPGTGEELMAGTRWKAGKADLYGYIMAEMPNYFKWYIRAAHDSNFENILFPERFSKETFQEILEREKIYKYSCQYLNNPTSPEGADFKEFKYYNIGVGPTGLKNLIIPKDGTPPVLLSKVLRMSFYDPSSGGKSATAENAIIVGGMDALKRIFVLAAWSKNCGFGTAVEKWHQLNDSFVCYANHFEAVGAHKEVAEIVAQRKWHVVCPYCQSDKPHRRLVPNPVQPPGSAGLKMKEERIRSYMQSTVEEHRLYLGPGMAELVRQLNSFPHGDLVDQVDSLAYLVHYLRPPMSDDEIETQRADEQIRKDAKVQRTNTEVVYGGYI